MILLIKLAAWALLAGPSFAKYVIPFADGSDGWEDAVTRAKGQLNCSASFSDSRSQPLLQLSSPK